MKITSKVGIEKEYFLLKEVINPTTIGFVQPVERVALDSFEVQEVPKVLPADDCHYLVELRTEPYDITRGVGALYGDFLERERSLKQQAKELGFILSDTPSFRVLPRKFAQNLLRRFGKTVDPHTRGNMYGKDVFYSDRYARAGIHIHFSLVAKFTEETELTYNRKLAERELPVRMDMPKIIHFFDSKFAKEIKAAKRRAGEYAMKDHGFEYRSLPASIETEALFEAISECSSKLGIF